MFDISGSTRAATILAIPAVYATAFGFMFSYGKLLMAMAKSRLFPSVFCKPAPAYVFGSVVGYAICLVVNFVPQIRHHLFNVCLLSACAAYCSQFYGFIAMRTRFASLSREFRNPLGIASAWFGMTVFALTAVALVGFQRDKCVAFIIYCCFCAICSLYYYLFARDNQKFSDDESKIMLIAHVIQRKYT